MFPKMTLTQNVGVKVKAFVVDLITKDNTNYLERFLLRFLFFCSCLFKQGIICKKIFRVRQTDTQCPIAKVCIGNIVVGGSGKTPAVIALTTLLSKKYKVAVISKGYLGKKVKKNKVHDVKQLDSPHFFGDEAVMIKKKCPDAAVLVSKNRNLALSEATKKNCQVAIFDDGLQDDSLKADINVIMVKSLDPIRKGFFLPRGFLRDDPNSLKKAQYIALFQNKEESSLEESEEYLKQFTSSPKFGFTPSRFSLHGEKAPPLESLSGSNIGVFSAIANPHLFERSLQDLGAQIVESYHLIDHSAFSKALLEKFICRCQSKGADYVICTLKDYVKLPPNFLSSLPILYLDYELEATYQKQVFQNLVKDIDLAIENYNTKQEISL